MKSNEIKAFIKEVFIHTIENMNATEENYAHYFSKDYIQYADGQILNYHDFIAHMKDQKNVMRSIKVIFKYLVAEGDTVATIHLVEGIKKNGDKIEAQVNALFQIQNRKIILCDELIHLIKGSESDRDIGSRH